MVHCFCLSIVFTHGVVRSSQDNGIRVGPPAPFIIKKETLRSNTGRGSLLPGMVVRWAASRCPNKFTVAFILFDHQLTTVLHLFPFVSDHGQDG